MNIEFRASLLAAAAVIAVSPVGAQQAAETSPVSVSDEIIVTAQRRADPINKIPVAISAVSGDDLRTFGIANVADLQNVVPGLNVGRNGFGLNINIRGVTTTDSTSKGSQAIAFNVDGVFVGRPFVQGVSFFDLERVEVLRGPQGTLYGRSSTGGAINLITRKPEIGVLGGSARVEFANYETKRAEVALNVPISDQFAIRIAANFNDRKGYMQPVDGKPADGFFVPARGLAARNDQVDRTVRVSGLFKPSDTFSARLTGTFGHIGGAGPGTAILNFLETKPRSQQLDIFPNPFLTENDNDFTNVDGEVNADFGSVSLKYLGARHSYDANELTSSTNNPFANGNPVPNNPRYTWRDYRGKVRTDLHEMQLSNSERGFIDYVVGANYYLEEIDESDHNWNAPVTNATLAGSVNGINPLNNTRHKSLGAFGQATVNVADRLAIVAGLRYSSDELRRVGTFAAGPGPWPNEQGGVCVAPQNCVGPDRSGEQAANKLTYRAGVNFQMTPRDLFYASIASGYKPGGFNDFAPGATGAAPYGPEELMAYEAGYKGRPFEGVRLTSALYYYDYSNAQISSLVNVNGNNVIFTRLVPAKLWGWENEADITLGRNTTLTVVGAFQHSEYVRFFAGITQTVDWTGLRLDKTPKFVGTFALNHSFEFKNTSAVKLRWFTKYSSEYVVSDFTTPLRVTQSSFTRSDATITYQAPENRFYVQGFVENIENRVQKIGQPNGFSPATIALVPNSTNLFVSTPRFYGVRLGVNY